MQHRQQVELSGSFIFSLSFKTDSGGSPCPVLYCKDGRYEGQSGQTFPKIARGNKCMRETLKLLSPIEKELSQSRVE